MTFTVTLPAIYAWDFIQNTSSTGIDVRDDREKQKRPFTKLPALSVGDNRKVVEFFKRIRLDTIGQTIYKEESIMNFIKDQVNCKGMKQFRVISSQARILGRLRGVFNK